MSLDRDVGDLAVTFGPAGMGAQTIVDVAGPDRLSAAYFLGETRIISLD